MYKQVYMLTEGGGDIDKNLLSCYCMLDCTYHGHPEI